MKAFSIRLLPPVLVLISLLPVVADDASPRQRLLMDFGWKFYLGNDWGLGETLDKAGQSFGPVTANFGMIDDEGWVHGKGHKVVEHHDFTSESSFPILKFLHDGANSIAVPVQNHEGQGGVNKGVFLEIHDKPTKSPWRRSLFNGLAQVIVQADQQPGTLRLTASAPGLEPAVLVVLAGAAAARPILP